jgi:hypothetical protein
MELSAMDGLREIIMANKLRFTLPILAVIISLGFIGILQAAPSSSTEVIEVQINYNDNQLTILGNGLSDGVTKPIVTLGEETLTISPGHTATVIVASALIVTIFRC